MAPPDGPLPLFSFEIDEIGPELDLVPLAARRALDAAGLRLPLDGWRSLGLDDRRKISFAGTAEIVDAAAVAAIVARAAPPAERISVVSDPDPRSPPAELHAAVVPPRTIDNAAWSQLRALDRYALAHALRRSRVRADLSILETAVDAILRPSSRSVASGAVTAPMSAAPATEPTTTPPPMTASAMTAPAATAPAARPEVASAPPKPSEISSHLNARGDVHMVDVGEKSETVRRAIASGIVKMKPETAARIARADAPKGEVLATARVAGILAAKRTPELIPLCHAIALTHVGVQIEVSAEEGLARVTATAEARDRTGVEMEAMVAASVTCLTIYDMLKGLDRAMVVSEIKLLEKSGGRSGHFVRETQGGEGS
ncbi:MAG TPA: cyclic pyranopterin monophosphate synthase MoaC [Polyangiaceae bacterium]|jgi:cyclic pyranopterin phosphate synthase|nr:cyclic pyranopterin monophosphate synthase MoaC [Polyangiaceae bacterium]